MAISGLKTLGGGVLGGIAGFFIAGPYGASIGFSLGASIGAGFEEKPGVETGRIEDKRVTGASYGEPISRVYGTITTPGNMIWTSGLIEDKDTKKEGGGLFSSGTKVTTYKYYMDVAILVSEGPIEGVARLWLNGKLKYSAVSGDSGVNISSSTSGPWDKITFYNGGETQTPDPTIEAREGVGNVSAMRGMSYFVIKRLRLLEFYNKAPNFKAEVVKDSTTSDPPSIVNNYDGANVIEYRQSAEYDSGIIRCASTSVSGLNSKYEFDHIIRVHDLYGNLLEEVTYEVREPVTASNGISFVPCQNEPRFALLANTQENGTQCRIYWNGEKIGTLAWPSAAADGPLGTNDAEAYGQDENRTLKKGNGEYYVTIAGNGKGLIRYLADANGRPSFTWDKARYFNDIAADSGSSETPGTSLNHWLFNDAENEDRFYWIYTAAGVNDNHYITYLDIDFNLLGYWSKTASGWTGNQTSYNALFGPGYMMAKTTSTSSTVTLRTWDPDVSNSTWTTSSVAGASGTFSGVIPLGDWGIATRYQIITRLPLIATGAQTLQSVVESICDDAGYDAGELDMSGLTGSVSGFRISSPSSARDSIQQLQLTNYFDLIEADYKAVGVMRGGASVVTIPVAEMAAHMDDSQIPDVIKREVADELELPRNVTFTYLNPDTNYESGTQAATRQVTEANKDSVVSVNVALTNDEAIRAAHVVLYNEYQNSRTLRFSLTEKYSYLTPADLITITDDGDSVLVRILSISENLRGLLDVVAVPEYTAIYTQIIQGSGSLTDYGTSVDFNGPARLAWLDMPILNNSDDNLGVYAGASGYLDSWKGHDFYKYNPVSLKYDNLLATFTKSGNVGVATDALGDFTGNAIDETNTVTINPAYPLDTLASATEADVITSGTVNRAVLGRPGRWEVLQFIDVTDNGDGTYTLSRLLRGRHGTIYAVGNHAAGDEFALVDPEQYIRLEYDVTDDLGTTISHKFKSKDDSIDDIDPVGLGLVGYSLMPFAPALVEAALSGSDWVVDWIARSRYTPGIINNSSLEDDIPDPEIASFTVDFLNGSGTVVRSETVAVGTYTYTYTAANQTTDFGSTQSDIIVVVYQKGTTLATEGHGYKLTTSTDTREIVDPKA